MAKFVDIVFDGPPGPESGRFVEVENELREGMNFGEWIERDDGYWVLRITRIADLEHQLETANAKLDRSVELLTNEAVECGAAKREATRLREALEKIKRLVVLRRRTGDGWLTPIVDDALADDGRAGEKA